MYKKIMLYCYISVFYILFQLIKKRFKVLQKGQHVLSWSVLQLCKVNDLGRVSI